MADYTWNGTISGEWNNMRNWSPAGIPGNGDNATIPSGKTTCKCSNSVEVNNLELHGNLELGDGVQLTVSSVDNQTSQSNVQQSVANFVPNANVQQTRVSNTKGEEATRMLYVITSVTTNN